MMASRAGGVETITETPLPAPVPLYGLPAWQADHGVLAGITARGAGSGRGFDLGLWSDAPVGEVMSRWRAFRQALPGFAAVVLGNQVHGADVETVDAGRGWIQIEGVDGWVTTTPGILLTVTVADCIPVYLDVPGRGVALLHAGWRGTAAGILGAGLERLLRASGAQPADVVMHCGVGICGGCYEVGSEVVTGCGAPAEGSGPWHLDLRSRLAAQAADLGIERISASSWCSAHDRPRFYSHRASGGSDGRMVAFIGMG
ncbi:MAG: polyphenol oxidase family protein [Gemmatimonadales bacterium]